MGLAREDENKLKLTSYSQLQAVQQADVNKLADKKLVNKLLNKLVDKLGEKLVNKLIDESVTVNDEHWFMMIESLLVAV